MTPLRPSGRSIHEEDEGNLTPDGRWSRGRVVSDVVSAAVASSPNLVSQIG